MGGCPRAPPGAGTAAVVGGGTTALSAAMRWPCRHRERLHAPLRPVRAGLASTGSPADACRSVAARFAAAPGGQQGNLKPAHAQPEPSWRKDSREANRPAAAGPFAFTPFWLPQRAEGSRCQAGGAQAWASGIEDRRTGRQAYLWTQISPNINFHVIWKLHKKAKKQRVRSRPISNDIGYPTGQVSHFLHSQLIDAARANKHFCVLRDLLSLIRLLEATVSPNQNIFLTSADITALYLSIKMDSGIQAMKWFMTTHTSMPLQL